MRMLGKRMRTLLAVALSLYGVHAQAALDASKVLVLENSVVDLVNNIEILRFDWTRGQDFCDVYASVYGSKRPSSTCNLFTNYTPPKFTAQNGWRIGNGNEIYDLFKRLSPSWYTPETATWYTAYYNTGLTPWSMMNLGGFYSPSLGYNSFIVATLKNDVPTNSWVSTVDLIPSTDGTAALRTSSGNISGNANISTLLVRDWLGEERPLFGVPLSFSFAALLLGFGLGFRRKKLDRDGDSLCVR